MYPRTLTAFRRFANLNAAQKASARELVKKTNAFCDTKELPEDCRAVLLDCYFFPTSDTTVCHNSYFHCDPLAPAQTHATLQKTS